MRDQVDTKESKVFFPNLDGLRFFCFLSVFLFHSFATNFETVRKESLYRFVKGFLVANGNLGVNFFFVLSGFLITYLLFAEKEKYKKISVRNFYVRRVLRIWPLFYFCVFFGFIIFPVLKRAFGEMPSETAHPFFYLVFLNNFDFIRNGLPDASSLGILWSVAVEEQFYLCWPLLIALVPRTKIKFLFLGIIAATFCFRLYHYQDYVTLEVSTFSCVSDMAVGGYLAYLAFYNRSFLRRVTQCSKGWWLLLYAVILAIFLFRRMIFGGNVFLIAADRLVISIVFGLVILEQNYAANSFYKMSRNKIISRWGVYTYGLYCLHMIGILFAAKGLAALGMNRNVYEVLFLEGGISLTVTLLMAYLSYHLFEKRFLRLKERFALIRTATTDTNDGGRPSRGGAGIFTRVPRKN